MGILRLELSGNDTRWEPRGLAVVVFWQQGAYGLHMGCVIWAPDYSIHWAKYRVIKKNPCGGGRNACGECSTRNTVGWESCMVSSVLNRAMWQIKERICMWWTSGIVMLYSMWWKYDREGFFSLFPGDKVVVSRDQWMHIVVICFVRICPTERECLGRQTKHEDALLNHQKLSFWETLLRFL